MTPDEIAIAHVSAVEANTLAALERETALVTRALKTIAHDDEPVLYAAFGLAQAIAPLVVAACVSARRAAAEDVTAESGLRIEPTRTDDSERGAKASRYYARQWLAGLAADGPWAERMERTHDAAAHARASIACYEIFRAYDDERRLAVAALRRQHKGLRERWVAQKDSLVCERCLRNDGHYADGDGEWPEGPRRPPLHAFCRCIIVVDGGSPRATPEEERSMARQLPNGSPLAARADSDADATSSCAMHVKAIDAARRMVDFVASTDVVDAHDEVIDQSSWVLDDYQKNPVVLFAHQSRELPIGKAVDVGVRGANGRQQLEARIEFATEEMNPKAEQVFKMLQAGFLKAVSVGFLPRLGRYEVRDGDEVFVWASCVLKEISVTPVPANPEALAKMKALAPRAGTDAAKAIDQLVQEYKHATQGAGSLDTINPPAVVPGDTSTGKDIIMTTANTEKKDSALEIAELKLEAKTANDRAAKAEADTRAGEAKIAALVTEKSAYEAQIKTLGEQRDAAVARAEKAESIVVEQEVEALVGKKITPAEKPVFLELRKSNPDLFAKMIEQRAPLALDAPVIAGKDEKNGVAKGLGGTADLLNEFNKGL